MTFGVFIVFFTSSGVDENIGAIVRWLGFGGILGFGRGSLFELLFDTFGKSGRRNDGLRANEEVC